MANNRTARVILGFVCGGVAFCLLFVAFVYPEVPTASYTLAGLLLTLLCLLAWMNQRALREAVKTRSVRYGANASLTVALVFAILVVASYLNYNHFYRADLTKNKSHSLSEQTIKILKDLDKDVKLEVFVKVGDRDSMRTLLDNYRYKSKKVEVEWIDPDRDPVRTKAANVKKYGTIVIKSGKLESRVDDATEEKLTNGILKVLRDKATTVCSLTGHGEHDIGGTSPEGYSRVMQELISQNYDAKPVSLAAEAKIPAECAVLLILGAEKSFFPQEGLIALRDWLDAGGRAFITVDPNMKVDVPQSKDMVELLGQWWFDLRNDIVLDPASKMAGVNATVPLIGVFSKESPVTRDMGANNVSLFPLTTTVNFKTGMPKDLTSFWLAKSTQYAFAKNHFVKEFATGKVSKDPNTDALGPNTVLAAVTGSRPGVTKPKRETRIIVAGTSQAGMNKWVDHGGNVDLILNSISWLAGDESLISIRPKEEGKERAMLSEVELAYSKFLTKLLIPGGSMLLGLVAWRRRRRL